MLRVHFTAEDLLQVTFAPEPAPLMELGLTVAVLQRTDTPAVLRRWQHRARQEFPGDARPLLELIPPSARGPVFLDPLSRGMEAGLDTVMATPRARVSAELDSRIPAILRPTPWIRRLAKKEREPWHELERALRAAYDGLLADSWPYIRSAFDAERAWHTRLLAQHGLRATLAGLGRGGRWEGTTLMYDSPDGVELIAVHDDAPSILVYRAAARLPLLGTGGRTTDVLSPLAALLGRTRAAALELLTRQHATTEVARELDISKSSASEHTKALRDARLITTHRDGKAVWHACTPLGLDLLTRWR